MVHTLVLTMLYSCGLNAHWIGSWPSIISCARSKFCGTGMSDAPHPGVHDRQCLDRDAAAVGREAGARPAGGPRAAERPRSPRVRAGSVQFDADLAQLGPMARPPEPLLQRRLVRQAAAEHER